MEKKLLERFLKNNCKKKKSEFKTEKLIQKKSDKLFVKWKGYDNSFNSWVDKREIVQVLYKMRQYFPKRDSTGITQNEAIFS